MAEIQISYAGVYWATTTILLYMFVISPGLVLIPTTKDISGRFIVNNSLAILACCLIVGLILLIRTWIIHCAKIAANNLPPDHQELSEISVECDSDQAAQPNEQPNNLITLNGIHANIFNIARVIYTILVVFVTPLPSYLIYLAKPELGLYAITVCCNLIFVGLCIVIPLSIWLMYKCGVKSCSMLGANCACCRRCIFGCSTLDE